MDLLIQLIGEVVGWLLWIVVWGLWSLILSPFWLISKVMEMAKVKHDADIPEIK